MIFAKSVLVIVYLLKFDIMTRCEALKNPCAIRRGSNWKGLSTFQHDREFCEFTDVVFGIRAFFVLMRTYHYKYKCNTLKDIISRYAPITENISVII